MDTDRRNKLDELATDLEEVKTTVEELVDDPPPDTDKRVLKKVKNAVERASDAASELEADRDK